MAYTYDDPSLTYDSPVGYAGGAIHPLNLHVEFAPDVAASAVPSGDQWRDISARVERIDIRYGRDDEFAQPSAGQMDLALDNSTGRFDPDNTAGPYYPNLKPLVWFRAYNRSGGVDTSLFYGQVSIEGWRLRASQFPDSTVSVTVLDMFEQLANTDLPSSVYALEVDADNPRAWYRLGESSGTVATDSSGNGHHGTYEGGATFNSRAGLIAEDPDNAIEFTPTSRLTGKTGSPPLSDWGFTLETWVDIPDAAIPNNATFYMQQADANPGGAYNRLFFGYIAMAGEAFLRISGIVNDNGDSFYREATAAMAPGIHHVVAYFPPVGAALPAGLRLWDNGVEVSSVGGSSYATMPAFPASMIYSAVGNEAGGPPGNGNPAGPLDEVAIYPTALSAARIAAHHAAGTNPWKGDRSDVRITKLLDAIGFPASLLAQVTDAEALTAEDRRASAFHEAGHVVIGEMWDVPCLGATIGGPGVAGRALVPPTGDVTIDVMVRFGGWYAERKVGGTEERRHHSFGMHNVTEDGCFSAEGSDFAAILDLLGDDEATLISLGQSTGAAFEDERAWAMVEALAEPLAERGWLTGAEVRAILDWVQAAAHASTP